jgi:type IV fimbrial biogenesis protein FimT
MPAAVTVRHSKVPGFGLIELLVALAAGTALLAMAAHGNQAWTAELKLRDRVESLVAAMNLARAEAIKRNARVNICPSSDAAQCAAKGRWESGWIIFADENGDGDRDDGEMLIGVEGPAYAGIVVSANAPVADYVSYTAFGQARRANGALQMGTFTVCAKGQRAFDVILAETGRVRVKRSTVRCA